MSAQPVIPEDVPLASERLGLALMQAVVSSDWLAEHDQRVRDSIAEAIMAECAPNGTRDRAARIARRGGPR